VEPDGSNTLGMTPHELASLIRQRSKGTTVVQERIMLVGSQMAGKASLVKSFISSSFQSTIPSRSDGAERTPPTQHSLQHHSSHSSSTSSCSPIHHSIPENERTNVWSLDNLVEGYQHSSDTRTSDERDGGDRVLGLCRTNGVLSHPSSVPILECDLLVGVLLGMDEVE
jgi:hypothetical protein